MSPAACQPVPVSDTDRQVIRLMDKLYLKGSSHGSRPLVTLLERDHGILVNRKRVQRPLRARAAAALANFRSSL